MSGFKYIMVLALVLGSTGSLQAGMCGPWLADAQPPVPGQRLPESTSATHALDRKQGISLMPPFGGPLLPVDLADPSANAPRHKVKELPAAPDSASLFLLAMGSLGALRLSHSVKKLHFGPIPEWYHTGGPRQIGHATAFDTISSSAWPAACFEQPVGERPALCFIRRELPSRWRPQVFHTSEAPRGPPAVF